jgi:hypothetical protein
MHGSKVHARHQKCMRVVKKFMHVVKKFSVGHESATFCLEFGGACKFSVEYVEMVLGNIDEWRRGGKS